VNRLARPLLYVGLVAIVAGLARYHSVVIDDYEFTGTSRFGWTIGYALVLIVATYAVGLPDLPRTRRQAVTSSVAAPLAAAAGVSIVQLVTGDALLPRFVVFGSVVLSIPWSLFCTAMARGGRLRAEARDRIVLVADHGEAEALRDELDGVPERPASLLNHLSVLEAQVRPNGERPLESLVAGVGANVVVLDREAIADQTIVAQAASLHEAGIRLRTVTMFYEEWLGKLPVAELERASLLFDIREVHGLRYLRLKRVLDLVAGAVGVVVLAVAVPFVLLGDLLGNRGPLLFRQERVGKHGHRFTILKFRTMVDVEGGTDGTWTDRDDPRITRFGRFMRAAHLDELPQVVNILRGDLSIVGPRPEQPRYVDELREKLPFYDVRHLVRPGLTGWAQVKYGYAGDERDALEKLQYEFWYLQHQSLALDARIIGRTIRSTAGGPGVGR
jgi:lipopolysaccharide/colanic/teichoic acid biosynthesis glycosyltransferase